VPFHKIHRFPLFILSDIRIPLSAFLPNRLFVILIEVIKRECKL
jgi:hypothetical protein